MTWSAALRAVAGFGLPGAAVPPPSQPLHLDAWGELLDESFRRHVTGHLVEGIHDGAIAATDEQWAEALDVHDQALGLDLTLERLLLEVLGQLEDSGVPARVLKGAAVAHTVYPDAGLRSFGDVDLLVPADRYDDAIEVLGASGARRRYSEPRPGFDRRFGKGVCLETPIGFEIDLHRTFVAGPFGLAADTDELFERPCTFSLGGQSVHCLDPEARFLHACYHASLGDVPPRLVAMRDVAQMLLGSTLDGDRVRDLCTRWRCGIVAQYAIHQTWAAFGLTREPELARWLRAFRPPAFERRALQAYLGPGRTYARQAVAGLHAIRGVRAKVAYARALLVPTDDYVHARDGGYLRRLGRGAGLLLDERTERRGRRPTAA